MEGLGHVPGYGVNSKVEIASERRVGFSRQASHRGNQYWELFWKPYAFGHREVAFLAGSVRFSARAKPFV